MIARAQRAYLVAVYYLSWLWFGLVGLALNLVCIPFLVLPRRWVPGRVVRTVIRGLFNFWLQWFHASRVVLVHWVGFDKPLSSGTVYVANHPTLVDATLLLARLPDAVCIFKPSLMRNPAVGPAAIMAGYVSGDAGLDSIRGAASRVASGCSLLIFPEGTRTAPEQAPGPFKPGFALIATQARAPVQLITLRATPEFTTRGRSWWKVPKIMPARFEVVLDRRWDFDESRSAADLAAAVEQRVAEGVGQAKP